MRLIKNIRKCIERIVDLFTFSIFLLLILMSGYAILDIKKVGSEAVLDEQMTATSEAIRANTVESFDELRKINPEIKAWVKVKDTHIDFPVAYYAFDNIKYLTRDYRGDFSSAGTPFLDYRNNEFNDDYTVIYGHHMNDGLMFSDIANFAEESYFESHKTGELFTPAKNYDFDIALFAKPEITSTQVYNVGLLANNANTVVYKDLLKVATFVNKEISITDADKIMLLSTCDRDTSDVRDVILVKLREKE